MEFFALKNNLVPILHEDPIDSEIIYVNVDFEWFGEILELPYMGR
jgi:hypothetical protein